MKFENKTEERIKFPLKGTVPEWITVRPGECMELEDENDNHHRALAHGLVVETVKKKAVKAVKAVKHKIAKNKVETKKVDEEVKSEEISEIEGEE